MIRIIEVCVHEIGEDKEWIEKVLEKIYIEIKCTDYFVTMKNIKKLDFMYENIILQARLQQYMTKNFQMYKLDLQKTEEPEIKLPTSIGS